MGRLNDLHYIFYGLCLHPFMFISFSKETTIIAFCEIFLSIIHKFYAVASRLTDGLTGDVLTI